MLKFDTDWPSEIAEISTLPEFQNAEIRIALPGTRDYDIDTGEWTGAPAEVLYEGQARVIGVRWGISYTGQSQGNSRDVKAIRFQIPYQGTERVRRTASVRVTSAPRNPGLTEFVFAITNDFQGSNAAARTFEATLDGDSEATNG